MAEDLKILQKTYDMVQYGYTALRQFPKSERLKVTLMVNK